MKKLFSIFLTVLCLEGVASKAQTPFSTMDSVDINNIHASVLVHGDMWWDPATTDARCTFPAGSGHGVSSAGAIWMSGYDAGSNLHVAAQTYRQDGNDYWPGPLDASDTLTYATSQKWAKIWKVTRQEILTFQALSAAGTATPTNTAAAIWEWPANGNTGAKGNGGAALTITEDMAPFKDINGNGVYEPQFGEYPDIPGDEALWWVFSDNGPTHNQTSGKPLGVEVHAMAFGFRRWDVSDNMIFYQYTVVNKSANNYQNFRIGQLADVDLGFYNDDFIGCDTIRGMGIVYNGTPTDAEYGNNLPMAGIILRGGTGFGFGSFMYYNNDPSATGNPATGPQFDNYLRSKFKDGTHATDDYTSAGTMTTGHGSGPLTNFVFTGNPADHTKWSECSSGNTPGDRRFVIATSDFELAAGANTTVTLILVATDPRTDNACGDAGVDFTHLDSVANSAITIYDEHYLLPTLAVNNLAVNSSINIYPNPANNKLFIEQTGTVVGDANIMIYNVMGQKMNVQANKNGGKTEIDISNLPAGLYNVLYRQGLAEQTTKFIKE